MPATALELWGGIECSISRVGEAFVSQLAMGGHRERPADLERVAALGIRTLRYPVLWEDTVSAVGAEPRWQHADAALAQLAGLGIDCVAGLVHHGSGPPGTSLVDPGFAEGLAEHAAAVAERYPWISQYTPVNEPLTTARFACLYGLWYPHLRDDRAFARALVNQCRGTVLAMRAVRRVNPAARLVQTEDLGRCHSTAPLRYQAEFENARRWITWDLLCGRVDRAHPLWGFLTGAGVSADELAWFADNPCPPGIIGINHYVTSDRFLHHRAERFPPCFRGGNGRERYADLEAVRMLSPPGPGLAGLLREAWQRYGLPLAVTEAHLACTREEQLRWLAGVWRAAERARAEGIDVRAVTPWALFGSFDWDSLMTDVRGHYEPGAFDVRGPAPRPTAVARLVADLAAGRAPECAHLLASPGWWERPERLAYRRTPVVAPPGARLRAGNGAKARPLLITGARGTLGQAFGRICALRGLPCIVLGRDALDIADAASVAAALARHRPWAVVNAAGYVRVDAAEHDREHCFRDNVEGPANLARACAAHDLPLVTFSSDLVFDGETSVPYVETDAVRPLNVYGQSKAHADAAVLAGHAGALVIRTSAFFGPWDDYNFVTTTLRALGRGERLVLADTGTVSPTYVPDLVDATLDLLLDGEHGLWHLNNRGVVSWLDFAREAAARANVAAAGLGTGPRPGAAGAPRPAYSAMTSGRGVLLPSLEDALRRYLAATR
jgi:dTDP-4-dehydrorhamnose reductase